MKVVLISLARAGSKRLPLKNMRELNGKPLAWYTLNLMDRFNFEKYVYTDIESLKDLVNRDFPGIQARTKPEKFAGDVHYTNIELSEYNQNIKADVFIYLPMTSPIRDYIKLNEGIKFLIEHLNDYDCMMSVRQMPDRFYYMDGAPLNFIMDHRNFNNNLSLHKKIYEETGSFYGFKTELLSEDFFINSKCLFVEDNINIDIDTIDDFDRAKRYMEGKKWN